MIRKEWKFTLLALILMCLMVFGSFVGSLNSAYMPSSNNEPKMVLREDITTPALDEMPLRMGADLVYDSESDRVIFFGGSTENLVPDYNETWSYDFNTNTWTNMSPATNPPASEWHQMAYHSGADRVVLFGGHVEGTGDSWINHNETWSYDFNTNTWANMTPALAPPAMCSGTMTYDSESDLIVLFGGWSDDGIWDLISETWTYDFDTNTWTNVTQSVQPMARAWSKMTYDSESDNIVLFGGFETETDGIPTLTDTWTFDANTNTWTEITTIGPTIIGELVYDSESDRVVFYGGSETFDEGLDVLRSETWTYDTNTETWEMMIHETKPPLRSRGEVVYDGESDRIIVFGGGEYFGHGDSEELYHDCWAYDLNNNLWNNVDWDWQEMTPTESPPATYNPAMTYDSESDLVVMFGGYADETYQATGLWGDNVTWCYDYNSNTWTNMSPSSAPSRRYGANMVYDEESDLIVLFGGRFDGSTFGDTWTFDVNSNTWKNMSPATAPEARRYYFMTYDSKSDLVILFGGYSGGQQFDDTWTYDVDTNTWTEMSPTGPRRSDGVMAYDEESELTVLFGGFSITSGSLEDTWVYNSTADTWTEMSPSSHPSKRADVMAVYDSSVDKIIMFGGWVSDSDVLEDTWTYNVNNNTWVEMNTLNAPSERGWNGLAFDSESNRTILFSGWMMGEADTWAYRYQINPPIIIPGPPRNLDVTTEDDGLGLTWDAPLPIEGVTVSGYNIYRGSESGDYEIMFELGNVLTYTDKTAGYDMTYYYAVTAFSVDGDGPYSNEESGSRDFIPTDNSIFSFIAYGDTRSSDATSVSSLHDDIVSHYLQHDPELIIHTGDLVNHGGEAYQWPLFDASISKIEEWDADIEFFSAAGNHEWYTDVYGVNDDDYSTYLDYVDFSDVVDTPGETELYYSFDWQGIHFIFLNTVEEWTSDVYTSLTAQMDWLETDFAGNHSFIVVSFHNPAYSIRADRADRWAQAESIRDTFHTLFVENGVDLVLSGHDHYYYRTVRDGIQYVVTAAGGAPLYDIDIETEGTSWQGGDIGFSEYHYCVASIIEGQLVVEVYLLDGTIADSFSLELPVTDGTLLLTVGIIAVVGVVLIVIVLIIKKKK